MNLITIIRKYNDTILSNKKYRVVDADNMIKSLRHQCYDILENESATHEAYKELNKITERILEFCEIKKLLQDEIHICYVRNTVENDFLKYYLDITNNEILNFLKD